MTLAASFIVTIGCAIAGVLVIALLFLALAKYL